jgi:hypothetical protein
MKLTLLTLSDLEQAINYWRTQHPSQGEERALSAQVNALATVYALMIYQGHAEVPLAQLPPLAQQLLADWRAQMT